MQVARVFEPGAAERRPPLIGLIVGLTREHLASGRRESAALEGAAIGRLLPGVTGRFGSLCAGGVRLSPAKSRPSDASP